MSIYEIWLTMCKYRLALWPCIANAFSSLQAPAYFFPAIPQWLDASTCLFVPSIPQFPQCLDFRWQYWPMASQSVLVKNRPDCWPLQFVQYNQWMGFLVVVIAIIMIATVIHIFSIIAILILIVMMGEEEALMIVQWWDERHRHGEKTKLMWR